MSKSQINFSVSFFPTSRRLFAILSYFFVFLNVIVGLFACLLRMLKGMILGLFFISRIDRTCLMQGFHKWDKGKSSMRYVTGGVLKIRFIGDTSS